MSDLALKPLLRGHFHQAAFFFSLGICSILLLDSYGTPSFLPTLVYASSLCTLFGVSALYHRPNWNARARVWMRRLDHSCIYFLIGGSATPICLLALPPETGVPAIKIMWIACALGVLRSLFWVHAPKWFSSLVYVSIGLLSLPYIPDFYRSLGAARTSLLGVGGIFYVVGAVVYATKRPNPIPKYFGYHEVFHLFVIIAAAVQFLVVYTLV